MEKIDDLIAFCQGQAEFHAKKSTGKGLKPERANVHAKLAQQFARAAEIAIDASNSLQGKKDASDDSSLFELDPFDLGDLPDDLINELSIARSDQDDAKVMQLFRIAKRPLTINEVMVGLYRKFGEQTKRTSVSARLFRMANRGELVNVSKGLYALPADEESESE